jgi:hypothetical protein
MRTYFWISLFMSYRITGERISAVGGACASPYCCTVALGVDPASNRNEDHLIAIFESIF